MFEIAVFIFHSISQLPVIFLDLISTFAKLDIFCCGDASKKADIGNGHILSKMAEIREKQNFHFSTSRRRGTKECF